MLSTVDPWHGLLIRNPYIPVTTPLYITYKAAAYVSDPFKEGEGTNEVVVGNPRVS